MKVIIAGIIIMCFVGRSKADTVDVSTSIFGEVDLSTSGITQTTEVDSEAAAEKALREVLNGPCTQAEREQIRMAIGLTPFYEEQIAASAKGIVSRTQKVQMSSNPKRKVSGSNTGVATKPHKGRATLPLP